MDEKADSDGFLRNRSHRPQKAPRDPLDNVLSRSFPSILRHEYNGLGERSGS